MKTIFQNKLVKKNSVLSSFAGVFNVCLNSTHVFSYRLLHLIRTLYCFGGNTWRKFSLTQINGWKGGTSWLGGCFGFYSGDGCTKASRRFTFCLHGSKLFLHNWTKLKFFNKEEGREMVVGKTSNCRSALLTQLTPTSSQCSRAFSHVYKRFS